MQSLPKCSTRQENQGLGFLAKLHREIEFDSIVIPTKSAKNKRIQFNLFIHLKKSKDTHWQWTSRSWWAEWIQEYNQNLQVIIETSSVAALSDSVGIRNGRSWISFQSCDWSAIFCPMFSLVDCDSMSIPGRNKERSISGSRLYYGQCCFLWACLSFC